MHQKSHTVAQTDFARGNEIADRKAKGALCMAPTENTLVDSPSQIYVASLKTVYGGGHGDWVWRILRVGFSEWHTHTGVHPSSWGILRKLSRRYFSGLEIVAWPVAIGIVDRLDRASDDYLYGLSV